MKVTGRDWDDHPESGIGLWDDETLDLEHAPTAREAVARLVREWRVGRFGVGRVRQ